MRYFGVRYIEEEALFYMGGKEALASALPINLNFSFVHRRWAFGQREAVRDAPRYPPGRVSSWERAPMGWPARLTWASLARKTSSLFRFRRMV